MSEDERAWLGRVAETAQATRPAWTVEPVGDGAGLRFSPPDGHDLTVELWLRPTAIEVRMHEWVHAIDRRALSEQPHEAEQDARGLAHDLVAAALWGWVELREEVVGARVWRTTVRIGPAGQRLTFERVGGGLRLPWPRPKVVVRSGARPVRPIAQKRLRPVPWAPWAGIRGDKIHEPPPVELPVTGELDLHLFSPKEVKPLVLEYIEQCRERGLTELRIVHGKGIGNLRRTVHALLDRHEHVAAYRLGGHGHGGGGWGATVVDLRPPGSTERRTPE